MKDSKFTVCQLIYTFIYESRCLKVNLLVVSIMDLQVMYVNTWGKRYKYM